MLPSKYRVRARFVPVLGLILATASQLLAQQKATVPDADAQQAARKMANEIYGGRFQQAKTAADKAALATEMIDSALTVQNGTADQYILLDIAREVAATAGEAPMALRAVEQLADRFDVPVGKLITESLMTAANRAAVSNQHKAIAEAALSVTGDLADAGEHDRAIELCEAAQSSAKKARESGLLKGLAAKAVELKEQQKAAQVYRDALAILEGDPTHPDANLTAGRYLCLVKGDWAEGVAMLALGSDAELKTVAAMDLRGAGSAEEQVGVGDAWWTLSETKQGSERDSLRLRAGFWYRQAEPSLPVGLAGMRSKLRLQELSKLDPQFPTPPQASGLDRSDLSDEQATPAAVLISETQRLIDQQDYNGARKKLLQVNQLDQGNAQACFYLGLLAALVEHNASDARKHFARVQQLGTKDVACLNNLALAAVRADDVNDAIGYWKASLEIGSAPEVSHNARLLLALADRNRIRMPSGARDWLESELKPAGMTGSSANGEISWYEGASVFSRASASEGWRYMDFTGTSAGSVGWRWPNLVDRACMQCNGLGAVNCQVNGCSRGRVRVSTTEVIPLPGGQVISKQRIVAVPCKVCRGSGRVACPFCTNGIDRDLSLRASGTIRTPAVSPTR